MSGTKGYDFKLVAAVSLGVFVGAMFERCYNQAAHTTDTMNTPCDCVPSMANARPPAFPKVVLRTDARGTTLSNAGEPGFEISEMEKADPQCFRDNSPPPIFIVDAGFNKGLLTGYWNSRHQRLKLKGGDPAPMCVLGFEPFGKLVQAYNQRSARIQGLRLVQAAVSVAAGQADYWYGSNQHGNKMIEDEGTIRTDLTIYKGGAAAGGFHDTVRTVRMEPFLRMMAEKLPAKTMWGLLKTDVQGADLNALKGAGDMIRRFQCVSMEIWGSTALGKASKDYEDPIPFLESHGFVYVPSPKLPATLFAEGSFSGHQITFINTRPEFRRSFNGPYEGYQHCCVPDAYLNEERENEMIRLIPTLLKAADAKAQDR